ncbi:membrane protein insertase YidC [Clostridium sp. cel8]|jgi:YidC/Oxa1 family membrane protein insertase|uniref:membrane protein insertase YidC n=1 Tax=Clostridium sp. cel8 TaxID=2663123 RepID=UPI0015F5727C|nr:membrane protein insertase YidC [Clostridium sp. cel8]MBA5852004.1 membrane protein insertase YidC [Clostridium sp. cel8]
MKYLNNAFVQFFEYLHDLVISVVPNQNLSYGIAIILMTIIIRLLILPLGVKQIRSSLIMNKIQPEIKKLQDKYKKDPQKMQKEMMKLYKEKGASPFSGCLPLLIQWPILIALYYVFNHLNGINGIGFLWIKDLGKPDIILALLSGITTFLASWLIMPTDNIEQASQTKKMNIGMSVFMIFISWKLKAALTLYWVVSNLIQVGQNFVIKKIEEKKGY